MMEFEPIGAMAGPAGRERRGSVRFALCLALAGVGHGGLLFALNAVGDAGAGTGGLVAQAIGVSIVDSRVLDAPLTPAASATQDAASSAAVAPMAPMPAAAAAPADLKPVEPLPVIASADPALREVEASQAKPEPDETRPDPVPQPRATAAPAVAAPAPVPTPEAKAASADSVAAEPAAVARTPAVAAASPGKMTAFSADIAALLMRASPKHPGSGSGRGRVVVRFTLAETGRLDGVRVLTSSGHPRLDAAAREVIERVRFPVPPAGMSTAQRTYDKEYEFR